MNNIDKQSIDLIGDAYKSYLIEDAKTLPNMSKEKMYELGYRLTKEEFINKIKTDNKFAQMWGLKIENRELSLEERVEIARKTLSKEIFYEYGNLSPFTKPIITYWLNQYNIPTKVISLIYDNETIEIYE
jgi:hypothetical protein